MAFPLPMPHRPGPRRIDHRQAHALHDVATTRAVEAQALAALPAHTLMQRAGLSAARLALATAPHARQVWVACGGGNNGGDGLEAALHLKTWGLQVTATLHGDMTRAPADAQAAWQRARDAGVQLQPWTGQPPPASGLIIDALLGIGLAQTLREPMADAIRAVNAHSAACGAPVLSIDLPSGLDADTGQRALDALGQPLAVHSHDCLALITLKPGLFTGHGRDHARRLWLDDLDVPVGSAAPVACLPGLAQVAWPARPHASHKGSHGDVVVLGGAAGMGGAALLAARAALLGGAGRVYVALLDGSGLTLDATVPELMFRAVDSLDWQQATVVCGCGGGDAIRAHLPRALSSAARLVLDADALNAIATDASLATLLRARTARAGRLTVLTPHPLEAARLLECSSAQVQAARVASAQALVRAFGATVVLKGSGSITAAPGQLPCINPTGNARLATAGTGDVLAGLIGARLAQGDTERDAALRAVWWHGAWADDAPGTDTAAGPQPGLPAWPAAAAGGFRASSLLERAAAAGAPRPAQPSGDDIHGR